MRNASSALITLLNTATELQIADLLTIIPQSGSSLYLTAAGVDVTAVSQVDGASHTFKAGGLDAAGIIRPTFQAGSTKIVIGTEFDQLDLTLMCDVVSTISGISWTQQARRGYFDGARICLERAFTATWGDWSAGTLIRFYGRVGSVKPSRNTIVMPVVSDLALLHRGMPRNVYQPGCLHNLFDAGCTLSKATFTATGTIAAGSTASAFNTNLSQPDGYYAQGTITFTSGVNSGLWRAVKSFANAGGVVVPTGAFPSAPATGDTFTIVPGCDKSQATCTNKFANLAHFRGFPFIPPPEAAS